MNEQNNLPVAYATFCDDLRQEIGNKVSYMGAYQGMMFVQSFPLALPKLCAAITLRLPINAVPKTLIFRLFLEDEMIAERNFESALLASHTGGEPGKDALYATAFFQLMPFVSDAPARLKARAYLDDSELKAGALNIRLLPSEDSPPSPPAVS